MIWITLDTPITQNGCCYSYSGVIRGGIIKVYMQHHYVIMSYNNY